MRGHAYGAPPRPPDAKPTRVTGLPGSTEFSMEDKLLMEGVMMTADGPLVEAKPVDEDKCAPWALVENDIEFAESSPLVMKHLFQECSIRLRLYCVCLSIAALTMLVSVAVTHFGTGAYEVHKGTPAPGATPSPSPTFVSDDLVDDLTPFSGHEALSTQSSPQHRVVGWLSSIDRSVLEPSNSLFIQHYIIVVVYFAMGGKKWMAQDKWLDPNLHECEWLSSICCSRDYSNRPCIISIDLSCTGLEGSIPPEIGYL